MPGVSALTMRGPDPSPLWSIPWSHVVGGQIAIDLTENITPRLAVTATNTALLQDMLTIEITIVGRVGKTRDVLRRQFLRATSGPVVHAFEVWEAYSVIEVSARNMSGGFTPDATYYDPSSPGHVGAGATLHYADLTCGIQARCVTPSTGDSKEGY
jgi:hypothetical protein